jgi:hypothetical protein
MRRRKIHTVSRFKNIPGNDENAPGTMRKKNVATDCLKSAKKKSEHMRQLVGAKCPVTLNFSSEPRDTRHYLPRECKCEIQ